MKIVVKDEKIISIYADNVDAKSLYPTSDIKWVPNNYSHKEPIQTTMPDGQIMYRINLAAGDTDPYVSEIDEAWKIKYYAELRKNEYPDAALYLDGIVKNDQEQIAAYIAACQAVKTKYPKS
jgi:hypothetical protein